MASAGATAFVTGAAGGIGTELIKELRTQGREVLGLAETREEAERVHCAGGVAVLGRLFEPGPWLDERRPTGCFIFRPIRSASGA
jgi:NAD(P)-dependent dehydrogenase (short-subunit alcohol dehydrogenase family)